MSFRPLLSLKQRQKSGRSKVFEWVCVLSSHFATKGNRWIKCVCVWKDLFVCGCVAGNTMCVGGKIFACMWGCVAGSKCVCLWKDLLQSMDFYLIHRCTKKRNGMQRINCNTKERWSLPECYMMPLIKFDKVLFARLYYIQSICSMIRLCWLITVNHCTNWHKTGSYPHQIYEW